MYEPVQRCTHCGANLTLDDLRKPNCTYCGTVLPHRAQAEQHAQVVGQVMNQMMGQQAQIQNQWRQGFGLGPMAPPPPMMGTPMYVANNDVSKGITRMILIMVAVIVGFSLLITVAGFLFAFLAAAPR